MQVSSAIHRATLWSIPRVVYIPWRFGKRRAPTSQPFQIAGGIAFLGTGGGITFREELEILSQRDPMPPG
jgi:hypothetical protein